MAAGSISITLSGKLASAPATCNNVGTATSTGPVFRLELPASASSAAIDEGSSSRPIDSAAAFEDLGLPPTMAARVLFVQTLTLSPFTVEITYETSGVVVRTMAGDGGIILETPAPDDRITQVRVQGQGQLAWYAAGDTIP